MFYCFALSETKRNNKSTARENENERIGTYFATRTRGDGRLATTWAVPSERYNDQPHCPKTQLQDPSPFSERGKKKKIQPCSPGGTTRDKRRRTHAARDKERTERFPTFPDKLEQPGPFRLRVYLARPLAQPVVSPDWQRDLIDETRTNTLEPRERHRNKRCRCDKAL